MQNDGFEKVQEEQTKKKDNLPAIKIGKTWKVNWEDGIVSFLKKLFQK